eukprot:320001-Prorocentrum_minimum.AAC.1
MIGSLPSRGCILPRAPFGRTGIFSRWTGETQAARTRAVNRTCPPTHAGLGHTRPPQRIDERI